MNSQKRQKLSSLLSKLVDGRGDNADLEAIELLISDDEEARTYYLHYLAIHTQLEHLGSEEKFAPRRARSRSTVWMATALATAAGLVVAAGIFFWEPFGERKESVPSSAAQTFAKDLEFEEVIAIVGSVENAQWNLSKLPPEPGFRVGRELIHLASGRLRLDFKEGEKITIEGPAYFEVIDNKLLRLDEGRLMVSVEDQASRFTVIVPDGAFVDLGTEFAVTVTPEGRSHIRVLNGKVMASSTNSQGNTGWEELLEGGEEYLLIKNAPPRKQPFAGKAATPLGSRIPPLSLDSSYAQAIQSSEPLAYWRFNVVQDSRKIPDEAGEVALELGGNAQISPSGSLLLNSRERAYALSSRAFPKINSSSGFSLELWAVSDSTEWQTLAGLVLDDPRPNDLKPSYLPHNPSLLLLERAGIMGSNSHHVHPNFAMRSVYYSPLAYTGGINAYSAADYLIHRWYHFAVVYEKGDLKIYVDGTLSGSTESNGQSDTHAYEVLLGRLHTLPTKTDARPWSGAIDEVALYDRALAATEIFQHFKAAKR